MADYIDRDAVYHAISVDGGLNAYEKAYCIDIVRKIPAADVAPVRHGQWVAQDETRSFCEIMDKFILENEVWMSIIMPEGTIEPEIQDNTGAGPVMQFYILLNALSRIVTETMDLMGIEKDAREDLVDGILDLVKRDIMEE